jgi:hypothetical protein
MASAFTLTTSGINRRCLIRTSFACVSNGVSQVARRYRNHWIYRRVAKFTAVAGKFSAIGIRFAAGPGARSALGTADTIGGIVLRAAGAPRTQERSRFAAIPPTGFLSTLQSKAH